METSETAERGEEVFKKPRKLGNPPCSNLRGYNSKKESLFGVVKEIDPDICILNETGLKGRNKVTYQGTKLFLETGKLKTWVE